MKIDTPWEKGAEVVAFYNVDDVGYFMYLDGREAEGAHVVKAADTTIVDDDRSHFKRFVKGDGSILWVEAAAFEGALLDAMVDHDRNAIREFWARRDARSTMAPPAPTPRVWFRSLFANRR